MGRKLEIHREPLSELLEPQAFLQSLGFVLAIDGCARGCRHCPTYGVLDRPQIVEWDTLKARASTLALAFRRFGLCPSQNTIACWRLSDPLDYRAADGGTWRTAADVAGLWCEFFHQGMYLVTTGSQGRARGAEDFRRIAANPAVVSQLKITVTPFDPRWGKQTYRDHLLRDLDQLQVLWDHRSTRNEVGDRQPRMRINAKCTEAQRSELEGFLDGVLRELDGMSLSDRVRSGCVAFKPIYDLGFLSDKTETIPGALSLKLAVGSEKGRRGVQTGVRPGGELFVVTMAEFDFAQPLDENGAPLLLSGLGI